MRRMFSEKQLHQIVAEVLSKNEVLSHIEYSEDDGIVLENIDLSVSSVDNIYFLGDEATLNDLLAERLKNPTCITNIEMTFAINPTGHQLYGADKASLTEQEVISIKDNMLFWIQKGYIKDNDTIYKILSYTISETEISFYCGEVYYVESSIDTYNIFSIKLDITTSSYKCDIQSA